MKKYTYHKKNVRIYISLLVCTSICLVSFLALIKENKYAIASEALDGVSYHYEEPTDFKAGTVEDISEKSITTECYKEKNEAQTELEITEKQDFSDVDTAEETEGTTLAWPDIAELNGVSIVSPANKEEFARHMNYVDYAKTAIPKEEAKQIDRVASHVKESFKNSDGEECMLMYLDAHSFYYEVVITANCDKIYEVSKVNK